MSKASAKALAELHGALAKEMKRILEDGVTATNDEGEIVKLTPGASHLNVIRQFLKDNSVENTVVAEELNQAAPKVALPFTNTDEFGLSH